MIHKQELREQEIAAAMYRVRFKDAKGDPIVAALFDRELAIANLERKLCRFDRLLGCVEAHGYVSEHCESGVVLLTLTFSPLKLVRFGPELCIEELQRMVSREITNYCRKELR